MKRSVFVFLSALVVLSLACGADGVALGFPVHREPLIVNVGSDYVYGELYVSDGCLYVTYVDSGSFGDSSAGALVVWPAGYRVTIDDSKVEVFDDGGVSVASVGDTVRVSGRVLGDLEGVDWDWAPEGSSGHKCGGPYWLVGDEVTRDVDGDAGDVGVGREVEFLPRLGNHRGPIVIPAMKVEGTLVVRDGCLRVVDSLGLRDFLVIWPPGFRVGSADGTVVLNGGGNVVARVGEEVDLGGGGHMGDFVLEGSSCSGLAFRAYEVYGLVEK